MLVVIFISCSYLINVDVVKVTIIYVVLLLYYMLYFQNVVNKLYNILQTNTNQSCRYAAFCCIFCLCWCIL